MMAASTGAMFTGWLVLVVVLGGLGAWTWLERRERSREADRREMERWAEPSLHGRTHDFTKDDMIDPYPELPDYQDWKWGP